MSTIAVIWLGFWTIVFFLVTNKTERTLNNWFKLVTVQAMLVTAVAIAWTYFQLRDVYQWYKESRNDP